MVLLLIGVDMHTTTELRSDILYSISLMCRRLPAEPGDGIVRRYPKIGSSYSLFLGDFHCKQGVGSYENYLSLGPGTATFMFHQGQPQLPPHRSCGRSSCSHWLNDLTRKFRVVPMSHIIKSFEGKLRPSSTRPLGYRAVQPRRRVQYHRLDRLRCAHVACRRTGRRFIWNRELRRRRKHVKEDGTCARRKPA